jgi:hypothetical protein
LFSGRFLATGLHATFVINGEIIEQVSNFEYFGCEISILDAQKYRSKKLKMFRYRRGTTE